MLAFKQKKTQLAAGLGAVALITAFAGWSYAAPWLALERLESAAARGDAAELAKLVDFEAVQLNLAQDLTDKTVEGLGLDPYSASAQTAYQTFLAVASKMATPEAMARMAEELKKPSKTAGAGSASTAGKWTWEGRYASLGRFEVDIVAPKSAAGPTPKIRIELGRQGPLSWRADRLTLPREKLSLPALTGKSPASAAGASLDKVEAPAL